jgi:membrane-bound serine protease (ClpP class)
MKQLILIQLLFFVLMLLPRLSVAEEFVIKEVSLLTVNSAITPATYDYLEYNFEKLSPESLILLKLNTPGGLVSTTKDIITLIGRTKKPIAIWITPEGASASSAGAIIASAAHFIFMSPGTSMGAATPVGLGEDIKQSDARNKALNDLAALVRSLSYSRGRPAGPFEKMITEAHSFTAQEAKKLGIIDGIITDEKEVLGIISKKSIALDGRLITITPKNTHFNKYSPTLGQKILEVLADPSTAYILFLIGVALIYLEFQAPGGYVAGAIGLCFIILSAIAFQVLPLNWGSLGLILAGIFLLILEVFIVSYGILSIGGIISFTIGSLFLFHGEGGYISIPYAVIISSLAGVILTLGLLLWFLLIKEKKQKVSADFFLPSGEKGYVLTKLGPREFQIKVRGEIWRAFSDDDLSVNDSIIVSEVDSNHLSIKVKKEIKI